LMLADFAFIIIFKFELFSDISDKFNMSKEVSIS
jgi:hypothetical protein